MEDESADHHGAEAAHGGERKVELRHRECDRETDREDREEAHLLADVQEIRRVDEVVRGHAEEHEQRERRDRGAVSGEDVAFHAHSIVTRGHRPTGFCPIFGDHGAYAGTME